MRYRRGLEVLALMRGSLRRRDGGPQRAHAGLRPDAVAFIALRIYGKSLAVILTRQTSKPKVFSFYVWGF
jgi:hypothetical protein